MLYSKERKTDPFRWCIGLVGVVPSVLVSVSVVVLVMVVIVVLVVVVAAVFVAVVGAGVVGAGGISMTEVHQKSTSLCGLSPSPLQLIVSLPSSLHPSLPPSLPPFS